MKVTHPIRFSVCTALAVMSLSIASLSAATIDDAFQNPPPVAKSRVMWMWMGSNVSKEGITSDLEALKAAGFGGAMMFALSDICTPWASGIQKSPTPELVAFTDPWWKLVRHAAEESNRLGLDFGMGNCPGYETSGGPWITPELSMQEIVVSKTPVKGPGKASLLLERAKVDPHANQMFPFYNPYTGVLEKPLVKARETFYRDIAVLALPASGVVAKDKVIDLTSRMGADGSLTWDVPAGEWIVYRFGYTTKGKLVQPAQWEAKGLECDKMNPEAVAFHMNHVLADVKKYIGPLAGKSFTNLHFDSYEAGEPSWTPNMRKEFGARRGYDLIPWLPVRSGRIVGSDAERTKFQQDFKTTISDLYRDVYYPTLKKMLNAAGLDLSSEPYGGPWKIEEVVPQLDRVLTEFWTSGADFKPYAGRGPLEKAAWASAKPVIEAEAFTGAPQFSKWDETPAKLKRIGDAAFVAGVNRLMLHQFAQQPWGGTYKPGMTMGQWGTHFTQNQTWWEPGKAWVAYLARCQAVLQWGKIVPPGAGDFSSDAPTIPILDGKTPSKIPALGAIHRRGDGTDVFFVANFSNEPVDALCTFAVSGLQPELWDPVRATKRILPQFESKDGRTTIPMRFAPSESFFVVFRKAPASDPATSSGANFPEWKPAAEITGPWQVQFDAKWGGPSNPVTFDSLQDWTRHADPGVKYFSGTAVYSRKFDVPADILARPLELDLGTVNHLARVKINGRDLGVVWTAPWRVAIPQGLLNEKGNELSVEVTNVWANRLIGDEQEPDDCTWIRGPRGNGRFLKEFPDWFLKKQPRPSKGRYGFTTWNYFTKDSALVPSGLLGPVRILASAL